MDMTSARRLPFSGRLVMIGFGSIGRAVLPLLLLFLTAALPAQSSDPARSLLDEARAQPVEIFADVAFALIPRLSPELQISTLTEIFDRAGEARDLYPTGYPDGKALDALSLRTRAVRTLLIIDATRGTTEWYIVEQDNPEDPLADAQTSLEGMQSLAG